jgi:predicted RNase H-like HicB family nuclease
MTYTIVIENAEDGGWSAYAPDLPGLLLTGNTREDLLGSAPSAIADYLDAMRERGLSPGKPGDHVANITVAL